ncbi:hypothetical protein AKJ16_DCAP02864 [Drosera capensis]
MTLCVVCKKKKKKLKLTPKVKIHNTHSIPTPIYPFPNSNTIGGPGAVDLPAPAPRPPHQHIYSLISIITIPKPKPSKNLVGSCGDGGKCNVSISVKGNETSAHISALKTKRRATKPSFSDQEMTQGRRRSRGYISFLTCNDPKGVAEHGTVKISRVTPKKRDQQDKNEQNRRKHKDLNTLLAEERRQEEEEMGIARIRGGKTSNLNHCQLMQVPQGTHKLTQWAIGQSHGVRSKDIATNLLNGAIDLQGSLVALTRMQEAVIDVPGSDKRRQQKLVTGGFDEGVLNLVQIKDDEYAEGFHSHSRSVEELKKVIREGLVKQKIGSEEPYDHVRLDSSPSNMPSTSSSQATMTNSSSFNSSDSSLSSTASQKTSEKSNLVAKVMGLEAMPSSPRRQMGSGTLSNLRRPLFDIDLPMVRQPKFPAHRADSKDEIVDGVLETMRLKGLLKRSAVDRACPYSHHLWSDDGQPPIVVIRPLSFSCWSLEDTVIADPPENGACHGKALTRPGSRREGTAKHDTSVSVNNLPEVEVDSGLIKSRYQGGIGCKQGREKTEGIVATAKEKRSVSPKKPGVPVPEERLKKRVSPKKPGVPVPEERLKKRGTEKRNNEVQKKAVAAAARKGVGKKTTKSGNKTRSQASSDLHGSKLKKPETGGQRTRLRIASQQSTNKEPNNLKSVQQGSKKIVVKRAASTGDHTHKEIKHTSNSRPLPRVAETSVGEELSVDGVGESQAQIRDTKGKKANSLGEIMSLSTHEDIADDQTDSHDSFYEIIVTNPKDGIHGNNPLHGLNEEGNRAQRKDDGLNPTKEVGMRAIRTNDADSVDNGHATKKLKAILISSPLFISRAEELFDLKEDLNLLMTHTSSNPKPNASASKVLVDYANQLLELKSHRHAQSSFLLPHPLISIHLKSTISMDEVLDETCDVIAALSCHSKPSLQTISVDGLTTLLARDMKYAGIRDEMWDIGWRSAFSVDEVERIVCQMEKLVLAGLVQEAVEDFMH